MTKSLSQNKNLEKLIQEIISGYEHLVKGIDRKAKIIEGRAYGGIIRANKGKFVESITKQIILIAWELLKGNSNRIEFKNKKIKIPIKRDYIDKIKAPAIRKYLLENIKKCYYLQKTDLHLYIDDKFVMAIECKAYTENAMMKRILVDFTLLKIVNPNLDCVLFQLESQLGGDYSQLGKITLGSFPTHTLLSHFNVNLLIITLLEGERKVDQPIHLPEYYKTLTKNSILNAINVIKEILKKYK